MASRKPKAAIIVRGHGDKVFYEAKFRHEGRQVKLRLGEAWLEPNEEGGWRKRRGRVPDGYLDKDGAIVKASETVTGYIKDASEKERVEHELRSRGVTFREVAHDYLAWQADVKAAKPSTLADYGYLLAEPGTPAKRGHRVSAGHIMKALGDRPAAKITTRDVESLLRSVDRTGVSARSVNKCRALVSAIFNYGCRASTFALPRNPAEEADKRKEPQRDTVSYYSPEEVEALARALESGQHRDPRRPAVSEKERELRSAEDLQDAVLVRLAVYAGLRQGELLALRWGDIDFVGQTVTVRRSFSGGAESSTKSGKVRQVPLPKQPAAALERLSRRGEFVSDRDLVFCNALGRALSPSALRRRYKAARDSAGLAPLRFHDLRHTYGSLLAAAGIDVVVIQASMGHGDPSTTARYLHARPASEQAERFTEVFQSPAPADDTALAGVAG